MLCQAIRSSSVGLLSAADILRKSTAMMACSSMRALHAGAQVAARAKLGIRHPYVAW